MWVTSLYMGNFLGPTVAGFLVDAFGFRASSTVFFAAFLLILIVDFFELAHTSNAHMKKKQKCDDCIELRHGG